MSKIRVSESAIIDAEPDEVYAIFADYRVEHPRILPKQYFKSLEIETGGKGAGTAFQSRVHTGGMEREYHMYVTEPAPGILVETDQLSNLVTTFTVKSVQNKQQASVQIATEWETPGIKGFFESLLAPSIMHRIYREELNILADYVKSKHSAISSAQ
jgi:Polyketide cyclase / dehydrase and lipid transport